MKKNESLLSKKFEKNTINTASIFGGQRAGIGTDSTGECQGTGCSETTGKTETTPGVTDWADIECGDEMIKGSVICPA